MKTRLLIVLGIAVAIATSAAILFFGTNIENNAVMKSDAELLDEINGQAVISYKSDDKEETDRQRTLMKDIIKGIASDSFGVNIAKVNLENSYFPFLPASELKPVDPESTKPICDFSSNIPVHLQKIPETEMFKLFMEKYSKFSIELDVQDERIHGSSVHYGIRSVSDDGNHSASIWIHADSCNDEILSNYIITCFDRMKDSVMTANTKERALSSLGHEEFCIVPLDSWHQAVYDYGQVISEQTRNHFKKAETMSKDYETVMRFQNELDRFSALSDIVNSMYHDESLNTIEKSIQEYNVKYGSLPDELLELIEQRVGNPMTDSEPEQESYKNADSVMDEHETRQVKLEWISDSDILSNGIGFNFPEDEFTEEDLKKLQEREWELRKMFENPDTPHEESSAAGKKFNEMQLRLQNPFQTGVPYELAKALREKIMSRELITDNLDLYLGEYPEHSGAWHTSDKHQAIIVDIKSEYFTMENLKRYDEFVRGFLGKEINILYKK